jgi:hypothetical protein
MYQSPIKKKTYDSSTGTYKWIEESISDGEAVNINQVDIPIQKGEKVQIKIRSISEAGWPANAIKSGWSTPVTIDFPAKLQTSDQVSQILLNSISEQNSLVIDETLSASGIDTHLQDSIPNPNSGDGTYFKHQSQYLSINKKEKSWQGVINSEGVMDLQSYIDNLTNNTYMSITDTATNTQYIATMARIIQELVRCNSTNFQFADLK